MIPEAVLMVRWIRATFEFDQLYKQTESKMRVTGKIKATAISVIKLVSL